MTFKLITLTQVSEAYRLEKGGSLLYWVLSPNLMFFAERTSNAVIGRTKQFKLPEEFEAVTVEVDNPMRVFWGIRHKETGGWAALHTDGDGNPKLAPFLDGEQFDSVTLEQRGG